MTGDGRVDRRQVVRQVIPSEVRDGRRLDGTACSVSTPP